MPELCGRDFGGKLSEKWSGCSGGNVLPSRPGVQVRGLRAVIFFGGGWRMVWEAGPVRVNHSG